MRKKKEQAGVYGVKARGEKNSNHHGLLSYIKNKHIDLVFYP